MSPFLWRELIVIASVYHDTPDREDAPDPKFDDCWYTMLAFRMIWVRQLWPAPPAQLDLKKGA